MTYHVPVLAKEVIDGLKLEPGMTVVDATLGGGGHSALMAEAIGGNGHLIGIDRDKQAIDAGQARLDAIPEASRPRIDLIHSRYDLGADNVVRLRLSEIDAVLLDLGVSSHQLDASERGFSFRDPNAPLDMRMDQGSMELTAADLLNDLPEGELVRVLRDYADERWASRIAKFVVERRNGALYRTTGQLIDTVLAAIPAAARPKDINPATRTFQALRIAVNHEFESLEKALRQFIDLLKPGGRIAVISYHSGEDRIVKQTFSTLSGKCSCPPHQPYCTCEASSPQIMLVTRKPIVPTSSEIADNARARSAKLRIAERLKLQKRAT
ncbi:MAG: 16S rRNA (cytosine(1402)-N(4))-methyltransferase RsmH [Capsulimonadaceae bacterium]|nr:16S rRNA (cytosine(1402)-N(4))-methyltransferase RsmH [Capsulimonadaceae bacterium]